MKFELPIFPLSLPTDVNVHKIDSKPWSPVYIVRSSLLDVFLKDGGHTRTNGKISRPISLFCRQALTRCNALFITSATEEQYLHNFRCWSPYIFIFFAMFSLRKVTWPSKEDRDGWVERKAPRVFNKEKSSHKFKIVLPV